MQGSWGQQQHWVDSYTDRNRENSGLVSKKPNRTLVLYLHPNPAMISRAVR